MALPPQPAADILFLFSLILLFGYPVFLFRCDTLLVRHPVLSAFDTRSVSHFQSALFQMQFLLSHSGSVFLHLSAFVLHPKVPAARSLFRLPTPVSPCQSLCSPQLPETVSAPHI